ncbi:sensor histidine kinase [Oceaniglobus ichthyenteri]|uniref:sensor histidine kinase n=1 Tax=Oceaniglobus ichthyenteri TaxID=2136177 RepID=UPI000D374E83|nr:HAMP domain-containing sensor histidine kinase [Oceaniglobus ichthyenteri]
MLARSAALRLTLAVAAGIIVLSLLAMGVQYQMTARELAAQNRALLASDVDAFAALYDQRRIIALREAIAFRAQTTAPEQALFLLQGKQGEVLAGNINAWPPDLPALAGSVSIEGARQFQHDQTPYLGVARMLPGGFPLLIARSETAAHTVLAALRRSIVGVGLALVLVGVLAGLAVSRVVIGRIDRLNRLADRVAAGDLGARLPGRRSDDEFGQLERHVHQMLDRIQNLNRATYRLSDAIAHELRTPLNRILQKLDRSPGSDAVRAEMRDAIRIFDSLLDISGAEAVSGSAPGLVPVNLGQLVGEVAELYEPLAEDKGISYAVDLTPDLWVLGDRNLIAQLVSNLLDNAIKFCAAGDAITTHLSHMGDRHILAITDTGPGLPDDLGDLAFERFVRGERDRAVTGHGLGLALVQAIATRHGARLTRPAVEKGFAISIAWPKVAPPPDISDDS